MKIGSLTCAYNEASTIGAALKCTKPFVDKQLVLVSSKPWSGYEYEPDGTFDIAEQLGADVYEDFWPTQHEQLNFGLELLKEYDFILILDADELYTTSDLKTLKLWCGSEEAQHSVAAMPRLIKTYWKDTDHVCQYHEGGFTILVRPTAGQFTRLRGFSAPSVLAPVTMHHLSYVRSDVNMSKKLDCTALERVGGTDIATPEAIAAERAVLEKWYQEKWLGWKDGMKDLHPINPEEYPEAVVDPLPKELKELL